MIREQVDGQDYDVLFEDINTNQRLIVFQDGERVGHKDLGLLTDTGSGVIKWCIKSILNEKRMNDFIFNPSGEIVL